MDRPVGGEAAGEEKTSEKSEGERRSANLKSHVLKQIASVLNTYIPVFSRRTHLYKFIIH